MTHAFVPNATIIGWATRTGERGDGLPALQEVAIPVPIPCRAMDPTAQQERTLREANINLAKMVDVRAVSLQYLGVVPAVGDRTLLRLNGEAEGAWWVVERTSHDPASAPGHLAPLTLTLSVADDDAPITEAGGGK